jgi:uncharacterized protein YjbI with pentapeptide repeats
MHRRALVVSLCLGLLLASSCSNKGATPPRAVPDRTWIGEGELGAGSGVAAGQRTVVVLDLEPGSASQRNTIPYIFDKDGAYRICIDESGQLIASAILEDASGKTVVSLDRTNLCQTVDLRAGAYALHVHHDGTAVGSDKVKAFVHPAARTPPASVKAARTPPASVTAVGGLGATSAPNPLPPTKGARYLGFGQGWLTADLFSGSPQRIRSVAGMFDNPIRFQFPSMSGSSFQCGQPSQPMRTCCFLKGGQLSDYLLGAQPFHLYDVTIAQNADCGSSDLLTYELKDSDASAISLNDALAITLYDSAATPYHFSNVEMSPLGMYPAYLVLVQATDASYAWWSQHIDERWQYVAVELPAEQIDAAVLDSLEMSMVIIYPTSDCTGTGMILYPLGLHARNDWSFAVWWVPMPSIGSVRVAHDTQMTYIEGWYQYTADGPPTVCRTLNPPSTPYGGGNSQFARTRPTLPILISDKKCRNCDLAGVNLAQTKLDQIDLTGAFLGWADLSGASLQGALLSNAVLSGATLNHANLSGANLCGTYWNATAESHGAASLTGAYLKNVNLAGANLSGATFTNASFYADGTSSCTATACDGQTAWPAQCATAAGATMTSTKMNDAYLTGVDFSGVVAQGVDFSNSILVGTAFRDATFGLDPSTAVPANFSQALLQGADFGNASATGTSFDSAYVDLTSGSEALGFTIKGPHDDFTGYWNAPGTAICVAYSYSTATVLPLVDQEGKCAGGVAPITEDCWSGAPRVPMEQSLMGAQFDKCDPFTGVDTTW